MVQIEQSELIAASISRVAPPATRKRPAQTRPVGLARISRCRHVVRSPTSKEKFVNEPLPHCCAQGEFPDAVTLNQVAASSFHNQRNNHLKARRDTDARAFSGETFNSIASF